MKVRGFFFWWPTLAHSCAALSPHMTSPAWWCGTVEAVGRSHLTREDVATESARHVRAFVFGVSPMYWASALPAWLPQSCRLFYSKVLWRLALSQSASILAVRGCSMLPVAVRCTRALCSSSRMSGAVRLTIAGMTASGEKPVMLTYASIQSASVTIASGWTGRLRPRWWTTSFRIA